MNKNLPSTFQFPYQLQLEYNLLMKSKGIFLRKQLNADPHKLETLYEQLINAWNQNHTEALNKTLDLKYQELRRIQNLIESNGTAYKAEEEQRFRIHIATKYQELKEEEKTSRDHITIKSQELTQKLNDLEMRRNDFKGAVEIWKTDINERKANLILRLAEFEDQQALLTDLEKLLDKLLQEKDSLLNQLTESKQTWMKNCEILDQQKTSLGSVLEKLKKKQLKVLKKIDQTKSNKSAEYNQILNLYQINLQTSKNQWMKNLETLNNQLNWNMTKSIDQLLEKLKLEKVESMEPFPETLKISFRLFPYSAILTTSTTIESDIRKLSIQLDQVLTRIGISKEDFFNRMDQNKKV